MASLLLAVATSAALYGAPAVAAPSPLPPEVGYRHGETSTARIAGTAGALRATSNTDSALFINPANMAVVRAYHLGALAEISPQARRQTYGAAIVDSIVSSARLAGGASGSYTLQDSDGVARKALDVRFALAYPLSEHLFIGAAARYLSLEQNGSLPGAHALQPSSAAGGLRGANIVKDITFDAGVTLRPVDLLSLSLVGYNLTNPDHGLLPLGFGGGVGVGTRRFTLEADAIGDFTTYSSTTVRAMLGGEVLVGDSVPLRAGYVYDQGPGSHTLAAGLGYTDMSYSLDLGVQRSVAGPSSTGIFITIKAHLESTGLTPDAMTY